MTYRIIAPLRHFYKQTRYLFHRCYNIHKYRSIISKGKTILFFKPIATGMDRHFEGYKWLC